MELLKSSELILEITNFHKKAGRWLAEVMFSTPLGSNLLAKITVTDLEGKPNPQSLKTIQSFFENISEHWKIFQNEMVRLNFGCTLDYAEWAPFQNFFVFSPGLVGLEEYDLLVIVDLVSDGMEEQSFYFCFADGQMVFSEKCT